MRTLPILVLFSLLVGCSSTEPQEKKHHGDHATVHHRFDDAEKWAQRFEDPERDAWQKPERVLELLALEADAKVADVGAATGYFPVRFARAAPQGVIYALDIEPNLVNYLNLRAHREGLTNLVSLVCTVDDPKIPEPVDLVFICDTYHHIGDRVAYFQRLKAKLRPGGRLAIVDFKQGDFPVGPKDPHKLPPEKVVAELKEAGYRLVEQTDELPYQYVLLLEAR
jgi:cyclopropane fatty-acyl-phospholipid synthase-like methyltransferase